MKRGLLIGTALLAAASLQGCPIFPDDTACVADVDCASGFQCDVASGACLPADGFACNQPSDCGANETCGQDRACHIGSCKWDDVGCVSGFECALDDGVWACVPVSDQPAVGGAGGNSAIGGTAGGGTAGGSFGGTASADGGAAGASAGGTSAAGASSAGASTMGGAGGKAAGGAGGGL